MEVSYVAHAIHADAKDAVAGYDSATVGDLSGNHTFGVFQFLIEIGGETYRVVIAADDAPLRVGNIPIDLHVPLTPRNLA